MIEFECMFVCIDKDEDDFVYVSENVKSDVYPENNTYDIMRLVNYANKNNRKGIEYIDVYAISINKRIEYWEVIE